MDLTERPEDPMASLLVEALATSETEAAPTPLRGRVLGAALVQRPPGRPAGSVAISPVEGYRRTVDDLAALLDRLSPVDWRATVAPYGWPVQGLIGHVLAVERLLGTRLGVDSFEVPPEIEVDHIAMGHDVVAAQQGRAPTDTQADWRAASRRTGEALAQVDLADRVDVHGVQWRWGPLLVARTLEVWTHTDDIRRAVGQALAAPDQQRLALMTDLAVRTIPLRLARAAPGAGGRLVRIVLTGPGGGAWSQSLGPGNGGGAGAGDGDRAESRPPDVRIVADAVSFCRLTAGRLTADELRPRVDGDEDLAAQILTEAAAFAV